MVWPNTENGHGAESGQFKPKCLGRVVRGNCHEWGRSSCVGLAAVWHADRVPSVLSNVLQSLTPCFRGLAPKGVCSHYPATDLCRNLEALASEELPTVPHLPRDPEGWRWLQHQVVHCFTAKALLKASGDPSYPY